MNDRRLPITETSSTTITLRGRELLSFSGCDYLGLAHHPAVERAFAEEMARSGLSTSASRETTGNRVAHVELERLLARFLGMEAALLAPNGYLANLIAAQGLAPDHRHAIVDSESHASIGDAVRAAGLSSSVFAHADAASVAREIAARPRDACAVMSDGVFPTSRSPFAPLAELHELVAQASVPGVLVVDDCHGLGVLGDLGRGSLERSRVAGPRILVTGTLSKSLGAHGGFVAGSRETIERIRARSLAYVCSSPIPAAMAAAAGAALGVLEHEPERVARLREHAAFVGRGLRDIGVSPASDELPVFTFVLEPRERMVAVERALMEAGFFVPIVHYPDRGAVASESFRLTLSAAHTRADVERLVAELRVLCHA